MVLSFVLGAIRDVLRKESPKSYDAGITAVKRLANSPWVGTYSF